MAIHPRAQLSQDAALPVDQRAVAVEGERVELGDVGHGGSPAAVFARLMAATRDRAPNWHRLTVRFTVGAPQNSDPRLKFLSP
jgi:hypothetical protein